MPYLDTLERGGILSIAELMDVGAALSTIDEVKDWIHFQVRLVHVHVSRAHIMCVRISLMLTIRNACAC
jgi:hypothetical protein